MNLTRQRAEEVFDRVLKYSTADETEATVSASSYALTRFANNTIHQNVAEENSYAFRTAGQRRADGTGQHQQIRRSLDPPALRERSGAGAIAAARSLRCCPCRGRKRIAPSTVFHETAQLTPQTRAETVAQVVERAEKDGLTAAGIFSSGASAFGLFNSRGMKAYHEETTSEFSVTMMGDSSSGWAKRTAPYWMELEPLELAERAAQKALASREPREIEPGRYTVILEPSAMLDLLGFMIFDFSGQAVNEQRSCFTGRVGQKVFGGNINLRDDVFHPLQTGAPFDGEGIPRQRVRIVEKGEVKNLVYARQTAQKLGVQPTGHGFPLPNEYAEAPHEYCDGRRPLQRGGHDQIHRARPAGDALLVHSGSGSLQENPDRHDARRHVLDRRWAGAAGRQKPALQSEPGGHAGPGGNDEPAQRTAGEESFEMVVPAAKIREFNFASTTKY